MDDEIKIRRISRGAHAEEEADYVPLPPDDDETNPPLSDYGGRSRTNWTGALSLGSAEAWEKTGRLAMYAFLFLAPILFLPFNAYPLDLSKQAVSAALLLIALISFAVITIQRRSMDYPVSLLAWSVFALIVVTGASAIFSLSRRASFYGGLVAPDTFAAFLMYALAFFLSFYFIRKENIKTLGKLLLCSAILLAAFSILQFFGIYLLPWDFTRQISFNPVGSLYGLGTVLATTLAIISVLPFKKMSGRIRLAVLLLGILTFTGLLVINFRMIWIAFAVFMIVVAAMRFVNGENMGLPLMMAVGAVFFALISSNLPVLANLPTEVRPSMNSSLAIAKDTLWGWRLPVGSGPNTFGYDYNMYRPQSLNQTVFWGVRFNQGYNALTTFLATVGILGFAAVLLLVILFLREAIRGWEKEYAAAISAGIMFLILQLFFAPMFFTQAALIFAGLGVLISVSGRRRELAFHDLNRAQAFGVFLFAIALIAVSLSMLYITGQKYLAAVRFNQGVRAFAAGNVDDSLKQMDRAVNLDPLRDEYWRNASQVVLAQVRNLVARAGAGAPDLQIPIQSGVASAVNAARRATEINPQEPLNWINLGNVYESLIGPAAGAEQFAEQSYRKAMELDPQNPSIPMQLARSLLAISGNSGVEAAMVELQKSIDLKPDYAAAHFLLAQLYMRQGQVSKAIQKVEEIKNSSPTDAGIGFQLGLLYYQNNQFDRAQAEFERAVGLSSDFSNARYFLGLLYDRKGQKNQAIEQFERIGYLNPDNQEVKTILANLRAGRSALASIVPPGAPPEDRSDVPVPEAENP